MTEFCQMSIILTRRWFDLSRNLVSSFFSNNCSLAFWFGHTNGSLRLILPRSWISIIGMLVFSTNCHLLITTTKLSEVSIILTGRWLNFSRYLISSFLPNESSLTSWFCNSDGTFRFVLSRSWISIVSVLVFTTDSHLFIRLTESF